MYDSFAKSKKNSKTYHIWEEGIQLQGFLHPKGIEPPLQMFFVLVMHWRNAGWAKERLQRRLKGITFKGEREGLMFGSCIKEDYYNNQAP